jgi:hypothetical protein
VVACGCENRVTYLISAFRDPRAPQPLLQPRPARCGEGGAAAAVTAAEPEVSCPQRPPIHRLYTTPPVSVVVPADALVGGCAAPEQWPDVVARLAGLLGVSDPDRNGWRRRRPAAGSLAGRRQGDRQRGLRLPPSTAGTWACWTSSPSSPMSTGTGGSGALTRARRPDQERVRTRLPCIERLKMPELPEPAGSRLVKKTKPTCSRGKKSMSDPKPSMPPASHRNCGTLAHALDAGCADDHDHGGESMGVRPRPGVVAVSATGDEVVVHLRRPEDLIAADPTGLLDDDGDRARTVPGVEELLAELLGRRRVGRGATVVLTVPASVLDEDVPGRLEAGVRRWAERRAEQLERERHVDRDEPPRRAHTPPHRGREDAQERRGGEARRRADRDDLDRRPQPRQRPAQRGNQRAERAERRDGREVAGDEVRHPVGETCEPRPTVSSLIVVSRPRRRGGSPATAGRGGAELSSSIVCSAMSSLPGEPCRLSSATAGQEALLISPIPEPVRVTLGLPT